MGCTHTSPTISPYNHIPIPTPVERLHTKSTYPTLELPPHVVVVTAPPVPSHVKGVLKKPYPYGRQRPEHLSRLRTKPLLMNRSVNFDEQVLVKPRTPTPDKVWYEKSSCTMPMRKHPRNDDDDYDYDDEEENASNSPDEEQIDDRQNDINSQIPSNNPTYKPKSKPNTMSRYESSSNINTYTNGHSKVSSSNRIKVRRKLPDLGPPQIVYAPTYQLPTQPAAMATNPQMTSQTSAVPIHHMSTQHLNNSLFRTPVVTSYQPLSQYSTTPSMQTPSTLSHPSIRQPSNGVPIVSLNPPPSVPHQSSVQQPIVSYPSNTAYSTTPLVPSIVNQPPAQITSQLS